MTITEKHLFKIFSWLSLMSNLFTSLSRVMDEMELLKVRKREESVIKLGTEERVKQKKNRSRKNTRKLKS